MMAEAENTMIYQVYEFARKCAAGRAKLKNRPPQWHSPGEAACPFVGLLIDSHGERRILCVNGGRVEH